MYKLINIFDVKAAIVFDIEANLNTSISLDTSGLVIELNPKALELPFVNFLDKTIGNRSDLYGSETFIRFDALTKILIYFIYAENIDSISFCKINNASNFLNGGVYFKENIQNTSSWKKCLINEGADEVFFCSDIIFKDIEFSRISINSSTFFILINDTVEGLAIDLNAFYLEKWNKYEFDFIKKYLQVISKENWLNDDEEQNIKKLNTLMENYKGNIFSNDIDNLLK